MVVKETVFDGMQSTKAMSTNALNMALLTTLSGGFDFEDKYETLFNNLFAHAVRTIEREVI